MVTLLSAILMLVGTTWIWAQLPARGCDDEEQSGTLGKTNQPLSVEELATVAADAGWSGPPANADANPTDDQQASSGGQHTIEEITKLKQNPVSGLKSVFLQTVNVPIGSGTAESFSIQPVWPFKLGEEWRLVTYTIIPIQWVPAVSPGGSSAFGLGNILFNGFFAPQKPKGNFVWGLGPAIQLPTRTDAVLGSSRVSMGPSVLLYGAGGPWAGGVVLQNFWSLGGSSSNKVNEFSAQYILYYNFPKAWYLQTNATIAANWLAPSGQRWTVPVGGGFGKTFQIGKSKLFYSASAQGFYNAERPDIVGAWTAIGQFQIIFAAPQ